MKTKDVINKFMSEENYLKAFGYVSEQNWNLATQNHINLTEFINQFLEYASDHGLDLVKTE